MKIQVNCFNVTETFFLSRLAYVKNLVYRKYFIVTDGE